ncbi:MULTISPECIES: DNA primase [Clostridia]|uniref:DNA primase n=1 Tax=Clostridia TaxID=186801 RepID=UPI000EA107F7|nr:MULTISPECIES: DNA primase [Clostridia]NBJ68546.1 DNA primase [Roseburia sp. 1XD42-34]RKI80766.1 DNA primase [Clostridium sp. 1xD42-85]
MANQIPESFIEEIRKANDIVDIIGDYIQLKKQGKNYFGLCPFHGEKTPSFSVTQDKQIFHCFGCGKGGNVVTFLMEMEHFSFYEAIQFLAERSGISMPQNVQRQKETSLSQESQDMLSAHEWLTKLYHHLLRFTKEGKEGYAYLKDRGIDEEAADAFQLGFSPNTDQFTAEFLKKKGYHEQLLVKAGLLQINELGQTTDRFRGRIIFPIRNHLGKTVAFGGRAVGDYKPKYINSPESELFHKGKLLYNFDLAKRYIRKENEAVLLEGQMDVIAAYQAGVRNTVATLGTALTEFQAKLLKRYVNTVIICYDGDRAGLAAAYKAAVLLQQCGCEVRVAYLESDMDPDSFIRTHGGQAFKNEVIKASDTFMTFYMRFLKKDYQLNLEADRIEYVETVLKRLAMVDSPIEREYYLKELSNEFEISMDALKDEISRYREKIGINKDNQPKNRYTSSTVWNTVKTKLLPAFHNAERQLIAYMLQDESIAAKVQEKIGASFHIEAHKIIATHLYAYYEEGNEPDVSLFLEKIKETNLQQEVTEIAMLPLQENISDKELNDYIQKIVANQTEKVTIQSLKEQQKSAEKQNDPIKAAQIAKQIIEINQQLKNTN